VGHVASTSAAKRLGFDIHKPEDAAQKKAALAGALTFKPARF
jgi:hypothetical protein